ncbi:hypothetical protein TanjilG_18347 [Lupinus angustifolius]|uniref:Protein DETOXIFICATION n=1 Tax=Lupinus angustifolius TaxID=3871 RepID=A0A1J7H248_LUPAN|nr:hypothetical protein TanjilG_18347 [Lupinus angustifolius]
MAVAENSGPEVPQFPNPHGNHDANVHSLSKDITKEVKKQVWLGGPLVSVSLLQYSLQMISIMFVGHLRKLPLSGASLGSSFASVSGYSILLGMGSALETLCGQAYGAGQRHMLGIHTQRAMLVLLGSSLLPNPQLETSVLSISLNTCWMVYTISVGLGCVISSRVSNELGAGNAQGALLALRVMMVIAILAGTTIGLVTISVRNVWGKLYSNEDEVIHYVAKMMLLLALSDFLDGFQCVLSGAARGCGWQNLCVLINFIAYYVVGIPSAIIFAFVLHIGGMGLWMGIICGLAVQGIALVIINLCKKSSAPISE